MTERTPEQERGDVIAYLERKIGNAAAIERSPAHAESAAAMRRAWEVARDDIRAGLHQDEIAVQGAGRADVEGPPV